MVFKEATDCCAGTAAIFGAPDVRKISQFLNGNLITCCEAVIPRCTIFTISDACDATALIRFNSMCITTATTRVVTVPDSNVTINRCIVVSNLADATDGELITWDACAAPTTVAAGACGFFLKSQGAGVVPVFAALPCGSTPTESFMVAASDETTALTTGLKLTFHMPYAFTLTDIKGSLTTGSCCGVVTVDVSEAGTTLMDCCKVQFDACETSTETACMPPVLTDTSLANNAVMTICVDAAGMCAAGLKITLIGTQT